jgi:Tetratricopeptide repeat
MPVESLPAIQLIRKAHPQGTPIPSWYERKFGPTFLDYSSGAGPSGSRASTMCGNGGSRRFTRDDLDVQKGCGAVSRSCGRSSRRGSFDTSPDSIARDKSTKPAAPSRPRWRSTATVATMNRLGLLEVDAGQTAEAPAAFTRDGRGSLERVVLDEPRKRSAGARRRRQSGIRLSTRARGERDLRRCANGLGVLVQQRKAEDAIAWFERALECSPDFYEARLNLGIAYQQRSNRDKAIATYRTLLADAPPGSAASDAPPPNCWRNSPK